MHNYRFLLLLPLVALALLATGCGGGSGPTAPEVTSANGFLAQEPGEDPIAVELDDNSASVAWDEGYKAWIVTASGTSALAKRSAGSNSVSVHLIIPVRNGAHTWSDASSPFPAYYMTITINGKDYRATEYRATEGTITITSAGEVGSMVSGTFSGTMTGDGTSLTITGGKFAAIRQADLMMGISGPANSLTISGEGLDSFMVDLGDGSNAVGWVYSDPLVYTSLAVSASNTMIAPGRDGLASMAIEYQANVAGLLHWNDADLRNHSTFTLRLGDKRYTGTDGYIQMGVLEPGLLGRIAGSFAGTMTNVETKATVEVTGRFFARRGN